MKKASEISAKYTHKISVAQRDDDWQEIDNLESDLEIQIIQYGRSCCDSILANLSNNGLIAKRIRALREANNYTQEFLAERMGISQTGYGKLERGDSLISIQRINQICEIYKIEIYKILAQKFEIEI